MAALATVVHMASRTDVRGDMCRHRRVGACLDAAVVRDAATALCHACVSHGDATSADAPPHVVARMKLLVATRTLPSRLAQEAAASSSPDAMHGVVPAIATALH